ncbi:MAG TPA: HAD-IIB family hydrolase [Polyangiaceae bacterium]
MRSLSELTCDEARSLRGLLFDLDDTFLSHGLLTREAYGALWKLADAKLRLVAVTGRPSGWGEVVARQWPIDAAVTENGAIVAVREGRGIELLDPCGGDERRARRIRLARLVESVRGRVAEVRLSDDVDARRSDVTWDVGERIRLPEDRVALLLDEIAKAGARSTRSSVHVHATFDVEDKASGTLRLLAARFGEDVTAARAHYAFVGDSGNDRACFNAFQVTFGVANVKSSLGGLGATPRYVAPSPMGMGFAEIAEAILAKRGGASGRS